MKISLDFYKRITYLSVMMLNGYTLTIKERYPMKIYTDSHDSCGEPLMLTIPPEHSELVKLYIQSYRAWVSVCNAWAMKKTKKSTLKKVCSGYHSVMKEMIDLNVFDNKWDYRTWWKIKN